MKETLAEADARVHDAQVDAAFHVFQRGAW
jgi:hypothetical protein